MTEKQKDRKTKSLIKTMDTDKHTDRNLQSRLFDQNDYFQKNIKTFCDVVNFAKGVRFDIPGKTVNKYVFYINT